MQPHATTLLPFQNIQIPEPKVEPALIIFLQLDLDFQTH